MAITTILLVILAVARQEREGEEAMAAQELLIAVASDLRLSLARADIAATVKSSQFQIAPLPLAGRLQAGTTFRAYIRGDWKPVTAPPSEPDPRHRVYELRMIPTQVPPPDSLLPIRLRLELWPANGSQSTAPLASLPADFPPP